MLLADYSLSGIVPLFPQDARRREIMLQVGTTYQQGTILGELLDSPGVFAAYDANNTDGTQIPKMVLEYNCVTDENGNTTLGEEASTDPGQWFRTVPAFFIGTFLTRELVGLDQAAIDAGLGRLVEGSVADGIFMMP